MTKTKSRKTKLKKPSGQATLEMVLIMLIFMAISTYSLRHFNGQNNILKSFVLGPWTTISGMMESGVWKEKQSARGNHPNNINRMWLGKGVTP